MSNIKVNGRSIGNLGHYEAEWHTDMSYNERTPIGSLLYSIEVPAVGGDTGFTNMYAAYDTLPVELKRAIVGLQCRHDSSRNSAGELRKGQKEVADQRDRDATVARPDDDATRRAQCIQSSALIRQRAATRCSSAAAAMLTSSAWGLPKVKTCSTSYGRTRRSGVSPGINSGKSEI